MSHPLAYANQSLYHANILLSGWRAELERGSVPQNQVNQAYASPVQTQLLDGYGWLLLAACRIRQLPDSPPRSVAICRRYRLAWCDPPRWKPARSWSRAVGSRR